MHTVYLFIVGRTVTASAINSSRALQARRQRAEMRRLKAPMTGIFYPQIWYSWARETGLQIAAWRWKFDSSSYCPKWARPISCQVVALSFEYVLLLNQIIWQQCAVRQYHSEFKSNHGTLLPNKSERTQTIDNYVLYGCAGSAHA